MSWSGGLSPLVRQPSPKRAERPAKAAPAPEAAAGSDQVLPTLTRLSEQKAEKRELAQRLADLQALLVEDLGQFEAVLETLPKGPARVQRGAHHLLRQGGKRLRPICVLLAAKLGEGGSQAALDLAVGAELVHNATLLHDDVVDLGDTRRGVTASRGLFGNATSIFAGDWLLIQALKRVRGARVEGTFDSLLEVIDAMIVAESIQLDARGTLDLSKDAWLQVVEGKTAALFRWAMHAGGCAGGLSQGACNALSHYGLHLGVAFQAIDDVLDLSGDPAQLGKGLFADLREGKMTWPLIVGFERDPQLRVRAELAIESDTFSDEFASAVTKSLRASGAISDCRAMAEARSQQAVEALACFERGPVVEALTAAAQAAVERGR